MSDRASHGSSMASHDQFAPETEQFDSYRRVRLPTQSGPQQPWYPPNYYHQHPGPALYSTNNLAPYPELVTQNAPARPRWGAFDPFDEEEQERRKKGKELVPIRPMMNRPLPPWSVYTGGYGPVAYAPLENTMWPALPSSQPAPIPSLPFQGDLEYTSGRPAKHVRHYSQLPGTSQRQRSRSRQSENKVIRDVNGVLTPSSGDLTLHLTMDLEEDLEDRLDEMSRLSRLGHFSEAKKFFQEHLQHHIDNPYVLVQYADLLLHQGDFKGVTLLKDDAMYRHEGEQVNSEELRILRVNWELLTVLAKSKTLDTLSGAPTVFEEAVNVLAAMAEDSPSDGPISSTEIEILALTLQLTGHPVLNSKWIKYGSRALTASSTTLSRLYQTLLRQGRIWDFHDLVVLLPTVEDIRALTYDIFGKDLIPSLETMVSDWSDSIHGYDASTTLGLLSILTHILLEPVGALEKECIDILKLCLSLAISVAENGPSGLKSRPYLRVLIGKSRFSETASRQAIDTLTAHLQSFVGIVHHSDIASLPVYVPLGIETPQWTTMDQPPELKDPIKLVLRTAVELGDLRTEVLARQELIRLSNNPRDEFDLLCDLQLTRQGNLNDYGLSLASKYLVSNTKMAMEELAILISRLLSKVASTDYWDPSHQWILNMLLYKLEGRSPSTIKHMLERSHTDYQNMDESLLREISRKMPLLKDWVDQQTGNSTQTRSKDTVLRAVSGSRRNGKPGTRRTRSPEAARTVEPSIRIRRSHADERKKERDIISTAGPKPEGNRQDRDPLSERKPRYVQAHPINHGHQSLIDQPRINQESPVITVPRPNDNPQGPRVTLIDRDDSVAMDLPRNTTHQDDDNLVAEIRQKLKAEYDKKLEVEMNSREERRKERMAILEGLKREVEAIRREAMEQAEKKARVEAQERIEQLNSERLLEESRLEKEKAMAKAEQAAAELDAKFKTAREMAVKEVEKRMKEEFEMRKMKEDEARKRAEHETRKRMEAEKRAYEEAKAAEQLREELRRKAEAETREKQQAEERALEAAMKQVEEERTRRWATERAERDVENRNQIHFKDAVGRKFTIPFSQGRTWQGFRELVEAAFAHVDVVGPEVQEGHYDLVGPDGSIILPQAWEQIIQPGWNITMQMWPMLPPNPPQPPGPVQPSIVVPSLLSTGVPPPPARPDPSANVEAVVIDEPDEQARDSTEQSGDNISSGYGSSTGSREKPSRTRRVANAFSALKTTIFRRRRRAESDAASSSASSLGDAYD